MLPGSPGANRSGYRGELAWRIPAGADTSTEAVAPSQEGVRCLALTRRSSAPTECGKPMTSLSTNRRWKGANFGKPHTFRDLRQA
jgi:hypothetical protein